MKKLKNYLIALLVSDNAKTYCYNRTLLVKSGNMRDAIQSIRENDIDIKDKVWSIMSICEIDENITDMKFLKSNYKEDLK